MHYGRIVTKSTKRRLRSEDSDQPGHKFSLFSHTPQSDLNMDLFFLSVCSATIILT